MATDTTDWQLAWVVLAIVGALIVRPVFAMGFGVMDKGPMMGGAWHPSLWGAGDGVSDWMLVIGVGLQLLALAVVRVAYLGDNALLSAGGASDPALEALRSASARGELDDRSRHLGRARPPLTGR